MALSDLLVAKVLSVMGISTVKLRNPSGKASQARTPLDVPGHPLSIHLERHGLVPRLHGKLNTISVASY
jgi:hypothetical protein